MKVINATPITPFGGLNFVISELDKHAIGKIISSHLPLLCEQSKYSWRDILYSYWSVFLSGGDCAEDLGDNFRSSLNQLPHLKVPSPDRVLARIKELAPEPTVFFTRRSKTTHQFAINDTLNELNLAICKKLLGESLNQATVDYDNTLCFTKKKDATRTFKFEDGYQPGVALIGSMVVYVENRDGKSTAHVGQAETLKRMFLQLQKQGIMVKHFRADSATYGLEMIDTIDEFAELFYVRARMSRTIEQAITQISRWEQVPDVKEEMYRGETSFIPFQRALRGTLKANELKTYRLVVTKEKRRDGQLNFFTGEAYIYRAIVTNDQELTADQVVHFYNQRGKAENEFDVLKNDFGWNKLPFSFLAQNNAYLLITAMCRNIYHYLINYFSKSIKGLKPNHRLKKFIFRFICIPAKWIKHAGQWHLRLFGNIAFKT
jgi:hypothetical protein